MQFVSLCYSISIVSSDMRARCGRISKPLFENTLSTGADEAGMQNNSFIHSFIITPQG